MSELQQIHILGMTVQEIEEVIVPLGMPKFTAKQIANWIYNKKAVSFDEMSNISQQNRELLKRHFAVGRISACDKQVSVDGTAKYLFRTDKGQFIESVYIPDGDRHTLCVSSQVGCKMSCRFCMTGRQGFKGNLSSSEILNQLFSVDESDLITNIVFMGMGEPLDNYDEVKRVFQLICSSEGLSWSPKRITLSTIGVNESLKDFVINEKCHLAISIHASDHEKRLALMPSEKKYPIAETISFLKQYDWSKQRRLSFEYIVFDGINDSIADARSLANLLQGLDCRINLIRFHKIPDSDLSPVDEQGMIRFRDFLSLKGFTTTIRTSRGEDIFAACGMLSTKKLEQDNKIIIPATEA